MVILGGYNHQRSEASAKAGLILDGKLTIVRTTLIILGVTSYHKLTNLWKLKKDCPFGANHKLINLVGTFLKI